MTTIYVDEPSAWRVPIAVFLVNFFIIGLMKSGGILLIAYQETVEIGSTALVLTPITNGAATGVLAPLAEFAARFLTSRLTVCLSGLFLCVTYTLAGFFLSSTTFYPLLGVFPGIAFAFSYCPVISINGLCFQKRRSTAVGIGFAGSSVGSMLMPMLITALLNMFPVRSLLPIIGAILLNICVAGVLLPTRIVDRDSNAVLVDQRPSKSIKCCCRRRHGNAKASTSEIDASRSGNNRAKHEDTFARAILRALPFLSCMVVVNFGYTTQMFAVTLFADECHYAPYFIAGFLTVQGVVDLVVRLTGGVVSDKLTNKHKSMLFGVAVFIQGIIALLLALLPSQAMFLVYSIVYASAGAIFMTVWSVVLVTIVGRLKFPLILSLFYMIFGFFNLPMGYVVGLIKDINGSFQGVLLMCSLSQILPGVFSFLSFFFFWDCLSAPEEPRQTDVPLNESEESVQLKL